MRILLTLFLFCPMLASASYTIEATRIGDFVMYSDLTTCTDTQFYTAYDDKVMFYDTNGDQLWLTNQNQKK